MQTDNILLNIIASKEWFNIQIIYDAILGWRIERVGGNFGIFINEKIALRIIAYLKSLNAGLREPIKLP